MRSRENELQLNKNILLFFIPDEQVEPDESNLEINYLKNNFCGKVITDIKELNKINYNPLIYLYGDIQGILDEIENKDGKIFCVISELSHNYNIDDNINIINLGQVPINIHNVGVFFRQFFNGGKNYFELLNKEHQFQSLTESNKEGSSYRKGLYITKVEEINDATNFNLLRCSTNLDGPTDNFRTTDYEIISTVNNISKYFFEQEIELNHVLAQVYNNIKIDGKDKKAKIKDHSDKTKDMPGNGLIAFCTFYQFNNFTKELHTPKDNIYDCHYKNTSVLTRLRFRLKKCVNDENLAKSFDVVLYPNSLFIISLLTNRLYTHEIIPSHLPVDKLPTRLGYVIRCSNTKAVFKDGHTFIKDKNELIKLEESTIEKEKLLRNTYYKENALADIIEYGKVDFSFNKGDYLKPLL